MKYLYSSVVFYIVLESIKITYEINKININNLNERGDNNDLSNANISCNIMYCKCSITETKYTESPLVLHGVVLAWLVCR